MDNINRFKNYKLLDFVLDDDFSEWALSPSTNTDLFWISWINSNPEKEDLVHEARQIILSLKVNEPVISDFEIASIIENTIVQLREEPLIVKKSRSLLYWVSSIAASVAIIMLVIFQSGKTKRSIYQQLVADAPVTLTEQYNTSGKPLKLRLDDGSYITLQNKSRLSYPLTFNDKHIRTVYLDGYATFSIAKNPMKPFLVYANGIVTKVLGTHFMINSTNKKATVEVTSGIVAVNAFTLKNARPEISNKKESGVILTRNQKVTYNSADQQLQASLNENPQLTDAAGEFEFVNAHIPQVFKTIETGYGIEVIYDEKILNNTTLTADLRNTTMYQKLDVICKIFNYHYEIIDRKIYINPQH